MEVITKNVVITKIYIRVIFHNFTKILNHENLELYSTLTVPTMHMHGARTIVGPFAFCMYKFHNDADKRRKLSICS